MEKLKILVLDGRRLKTIQKSIAKAYGKKAKIVGINYWRGEKIPNDSFDIVFLQASLIIARTPFLTGRGEPVFDFADFRQKHPCRIVAVSAHMEWLQLIKPYVSVILTRRQTEKRKTLLEFLSATTLI
jgi:hypothetical protein